MPSGAVWCDGVQGKDWEAKRCWVRSVEMKTAEVKSVERSGTWLGWKWGVQEKGGNKIKCRRVGE